MLGWFATEKRMRCDQTWRHVFSAGPAPEAKSRTKSGPQVREAASHCSSSVTALFRAASADRPQDLLRYLARREVFGHLKRTVDHFDDVANEIEAIVVEHV